MSDEAPKPVDESVPARRSRARDQGVKAAADPKADYPIQRGARLTPEASLGYGLELKNAQDAALAELSAKSPSSTATTILTTETPPVTPPDHSAERTERLNTDLATTDHLVESPAKSVPNITPAELETWNTYSARESVMDMPTYIGMLNKLVEANWLKPNQAKNLVEAAQANNAKLAEAKTSAIATPPAETTPSEPSTTTSQDQQHLAQTLMQEYKKLPPEEQAKIRQGVVEYNFFIKGGEYNANRLRRLLTDMRAKQEQTGQPVDYIDRVLNNLTPEVSPLNAMLEGFNKSGVTVAAAEARAEAAREKRRAAALRGAETHRLNQAEKQAKANIDTQLATIESKASETMSDAIKAAGERRAQEVEAANRKFEALTTEIEADFADVLAFTRGETVPNPGRVLFYLKGTRDSVAPEMVQAHDALITRAEQQTAEAEARATTARADETARHEAAAQWVAERAQINDWFTKARENHVATVFTTTADQVRRRRSQNVVNQTLDSSLELAVTNENQAATTELTRAIQAAQAPDEATLRALLPDQATAQHTYEIFDGLVTTLNDQQKATTNPDQRRQLQTDIDNLRRTRTNVGEVLANYQLSNY